MFGILKTRMKRYMEMRAIETMKKLSRSNYKKKELETASFFANISHNNLHTYFCKTIGDGEIGPRVPSPSIAMGMMRERLALAPLLLFVYCCCCCTMRGAFSCCVGDITR